MGAGVGYQLGGAEGATLGVRVSTVGYADGNSLASGVGYEVGLVEGWRDGPSEGTGLGNAVGVSDGSPEGLALGA